MPKRKVLSLFLALVLALSLPLTAFAATGYGPGTVDPVEPYEPPVVEEIEEDVGGGGGGGGSPVVETAPEQIASNVSSAVSAATSSGSGNATATIRNTTGTVPASTLQNAFSNASDSGVDLVIQVDQVKDGAVQTRMYINEEIAGSLSGDVDLTVSIEPEAVAKTTETFQNYFDNELAVVSFGQQGAFGANIPVAVKVDLTKLDTSSLVFYSYDKATNTYVRIPVTYAVDANGYLHFTTPMGGDIIISDKPLTAK